jgi:hypothetical protein
MAKEEAALPLIQQVTGYKFRSYNSLYPDPPSKRSYALGLVEGTGLVVMEVVKEFEARAKTTADDARDDLRTGLDLAVVELGEQQIEPKVAEEVETTETRILTWDFRE